MGKTAAVAITPLVLSILPLQGGLCLQCNRSIDCIILWAKEYKAFDVGPHSPLKNFLPWVLVLSY